MSPIASVYRRFLRNTLIAGITGSAGKTTATDLTYRVLTSTGTGTVSCGARNLLDEVVGTLMRTRPRHRFSVIEIGASAPGSLDKMLRVAQPDIGIVLTIGLDHYSAFRGREAVAREKAKLVECLRPSGWAVLNADDPLVADMAEKAGCRVLTFGESDSAGLRYENSRSVWPEPLTFDLLIDHQRHRVKTQFHGIQWLPSIMAAAATGLIAGIDPESIVRAIETAPPTDGRMSTCESHGVTFVCDDVKAPYWSIDYALDFMRTAQSARKIWVSGTISDYPGDSSRKYRSIAARALECHDRVIFIGRNSGSVTKRGQQKNNPNLKHFNTIHEADRYLQAELRTGDLVMLKGSLRVDHLRRLIHNREEPISCWRMNCGILKPCRNCELLYQTSRPTRPEWDPGVPNNQAGKGPSSTDKA
jgi:UDP-N-acetylmuramyl pentapeptide synthase